MTPPPCRPAGVHLLADLYGVAQDKLQHAASLEAMLRRAAQAAGAHVLSGHFHGFGEGLGVTGVLLLAESHISIHTWPEYGFAAADIFMCGNARPQEAMQYIRTALAPASCTVQTQPRGHAYPWDVLPLPSETSAMPPISTCTSAPLKPC